jgi:hypothetical protein
MGCKEAPKQKNNLDVSNIHNQSVLKYLENRHPTAIYQNMPPELVDVTLLGAHPDITEVLWTDLLQSCHRIADGFYMTFLFWLILIQVLFLDLRKEHCRLYFVWMKKILMS